MAKQKYDPNSAFKSIVGITEEEEKQVEETQATETKTEGEKPLVVPKGKEERRNKSVHVLVKPSVHKQAQKKCKQIGVSLNECINQLLENWIN